MTNAEAISLLRGLEKSLDGYCELNEDGKKAFNKAISALEAQEWVLCSERLPEYGEDYKSCMECLDGAVWYFTANGSMGLGYYYESTKQWSTTNDLKTDGKVIAWKPLPEPYREDGNEQ